MRFVVLSAVSVALFFSPWGKVLTTHRPQGFLDLEGGGQPSQSTVQAIERATGTRLQARTQVTGYQYGFQVGFAGYGYLACAVVALALSLVQKEAPKEQMTLGIAILSAIGFAALAFLFLPRIRFLAWGAGLSMLSMLALCAVAFVWLVAERRKCDTQPPQEP